MASKREPYLRDLTRAVVQLPKGTYTPAKIQEHLKCKSRRVVYTILMVFQTIHCTPEHLTLDYRGAEMSNSGSLMRRSAVHMVQLLWRVKEPYVLADLIYHLDKRSRAYYDVHNVLHGVGLVYCDPPGSRRFRVHSMLRQLQTPIYIEPLRLTLGVHSRTRAAAAAAATAEATASVARELFPDL
jgi:hypothetical protein